MAKGGEYGNVDVPKKAIQAQGIIYQASTLMSVAEQAGIPTVKVKDVDVKWDVTKGTTGKDDVAIDADVDAGKLEYRTISTAIKWSIYKYMILEGSKLHAREPNALWQDSVRSAAEYLAAVRDYRTLSAVKAGKASEAAAGALWTASTADPEDDVVTALRTIADESNIKQGEKITVMIPAKAAYEIKRLTLIGNIQRTIEDYLSKSFQLQFFTYRPYIDEDGNAILDALGNDATVFVQGRNTALQFMFDPAEANRRKIPLVEHSRLHGRGDLYTQKMGTAALAIWDGIQTFSATTPLTARIYNITDIKD